MKIEIKGTKRFAIQSGTSWNMRANKLVQEIPSSTQAPFIFDDAFFRVGDEFKLNGELKHITAVEYAVTTKAVIFEYEIEDGKAPPLTEWLTICD